ncbi:hypothetical protein IP84_17085 [beta proteobacterium AAP99]|nr:hypothetical protein IP84_17085 [beta proteobacterium AAP99]
MWLVQNGLSYHPGDRSYNEVNPGLGLEKRLSPNLTAMLGAYKNSEAKNGAYGGVQWTPLKGDGWRVGLMGGLATGYEMAPVVPMAGLLAALEGDKQGLNLMFLPNPVKPKSSAFGLQYKRRF